MSAVTVKFFARLREQTGVDELLVPLAMAGDLAALKQHLLDEHPDWQDYFATPLLTAVNQTMVVENLSLTDDDEVAFFPPVTGG